jgi:chorismate synthase
MSVLNTSRGPLELRELHSMEEMEAAETLQQAVWGHDTYPTPKEILIPVQFEGGLLAGAFTAAGEMVALVFSFPTQDPAVVHSHVLATLSEWRSQGIGAALKWFQRDWYLPRGVRHVRWTVDPLRANNAALNVHKLGGKASTYLPNYYGLMQGIDAGGPTDRLLLDWTIDSPRVCALAQRPAPDDGFPDAFPLCAVEDGKPVRAQFNRSDAALRLPLPGNFIALSKTDPALALTWRMETRDLFLHYFEMGYEISDFTQVGGPAYILEPRRDV